MNATAVKSPNLTGSSLASDAPNDRSERDLTGGPFVAAESDPGLFTTLVHTLGVQDFGSPSSTISDHYRRIYYLAFC